MIVKYVICSLHLFNNFVVLVLGILQIAWQEKKSYRDDSRYELQKPEFELSG